MRFDWLKTQSKKSIRQKSTVLINLELRRLRFQESKARISAGRSKESEIYSQ